MSHDSSEEIRRTKRLSKASTMKQKPWSIQTSVRRQVSSQPKKAKPGPWQLSLVVGWKRFHAKVVVLSIEDGRK